MIAGPCLQSTSYRSFFVSGAGLKAACPDRPDSGHSLGRLLSMARYISGMRRMLALSFIMLSSCSKREPPDANIMFADKPPVATVRMLEERLAAEPCIGSLNRWSRHYRYWAPKARLDRHSIIIDFKQAGYHGRPAGMLIEPIYRERTLDLDHSEFQTAFGIYDDRRRVIRFWSCGSNTRSSAPPATRPDLPL